MIVALDGKTQEINQISQGRMGDSIVCRQAYGRKARGKYGTDGGMGFHAHGKAQNKEATFLAFHPIRKLQELISTRELAIDMEYCDHAQEYSYTHKVTEHRRKQSSGVGGGENSGNGKSYIDQVGKSNQGKEIS